MPTRSVKYSVSCASDRCVDLVIEVPADAPDGARVGLDGLGLQPLELEVLEMRLVLPVKVRAAMSFVMLVYPHEILQNQTPRD